MNDDAIDAAVKEADEVLKEHERADIDDELERARAFIIEARHARYNDIYLYAVRPLARFDH